MDIRNMKRKELQALCKKNKIPANLTNLEMANRLESLLKEREKPIARGKSCIKGSGEEASEINSDHAKRLSKKVRFSPENETFEFLASEIKPAERGRRERAGKRSMLRQVEGIQGIVTEHDVNKSVGETKSKVKKVANIVEYAVKTKGVKGSQNAVAFEGVSNVETRVATRSLMIKEVEKKEEAIDDRLSWKNQTKRTTRDRGMKMVNRASDFRENKGNKGVEEDGVTEVELVRRGRKKRKQAQLVDDTSNTGTSSKTVCKLEVVLEIEEPLRRSGRVGNRRQSVVPKTEKLSTVKDKTKNKTLVPSLIDDAKPMRSSSRLTSVAASDDAVAENVIKNKPGNRKRGLVLDEQNLVIIEGERENNILNRRFPVEENATRKSSRRKSIVPSNKSLAENVKKHKHTGGRKMYMKSGEEEVPFSKRSIDVEERPRKSKQNDAKVKKALVTDRTGEAVNSKMLSTKSKEVHAQSLSLEEGITVVESDGGCVMDSTGVLCDNLEDKDVFEETVSLEEKNSLKMTGLVGKISDSFKLQNDHEDTVSGICGLEVVLNINTEDEVTYKKYENEVLQDHYSANEFEVEKNIGKAVGLAEDQLNCIGLGANQVEDLDFKNVMELVEDGESEIQSCGTLESQKDEENREEIEIEDDSGTNDLDSLEPEVESKEDHLTIDQPDCLANPADNLKLGIEFGKFEENKSENEASCFDSVLVNYSQTEGKEDGLFQGNKSNKDFNSNSFAVLESEVEPIQAIGDVSPDGDEAYPESDQSICLAKRDENIEIKELEMSETNDIGKHSDLKSTEEQHSVEPEVVLINSYIEKSTPGQEKGIDRHELGGKFADFSGGLSNNRVDVENSYGREVKHFVELEDISDNSYGEKNLTILVHEDFEHNVEDCSAQNKAIDNTEVHIENSNESEPKDSCFVQSSDKHGFTPSKTEPMISDDFENSVILEPIDGEESTYKLGFEDQLSLEKASSLNENIEIVKENSSLHYTSDQNKITGFQVEVEQKDESEMSSDKNIGESVGTPSETSRAEDSNLKEKKHSTQKSVSNDIKNLMMVDLDWTPTSNFRKVHTETAEDQNEVTNENISEEDCQSPFPHDDIAVADMPGGSFILCENSEMEKPISTEEIQNSGEKNKNKSFGDCYSTELEESEGTENEFDTDFNTLNKESETQPFEATSPQTFSGFAEDQGFDTLNVENETQPCEATSPQTTSGNAEHQGIVPASNVEDVFDEKLLGPIEYKDDDTQIIGSLHDVFADDKCIETNILPNSFASNFKSVQTITPSNTQEMTCVEEGNPANLESTDGDELANKIDVEGLLSKDKESILRENFEVVNLEIKESSLVYTSDKNEVTSCQVEVVRKDVAHISLEHDISGSVRSPFVTSRDQPSNLKAQNYSIRADSIRAATPKSVSDEIQSLMMVDLDWTPTSEFQKVQTDFMPQEDQATFAFPVVEDQNKMITESINGADRHSTLFPEKIVVADMSKSGEHGRNQGVGYDFSTEPEGSQGTENEFENETQPFSATSPQKHQGNSSTIVDVSPTELGLLFDDETQHDVNSGSVAVSKDDNDVIDEDVIGPIEHRNEETQLIGSFDDDGFADTLCIETMTCKASASKSVHTTYLAREANEGDEDMVSLQGYDDTFKEIAFENVEKANIVDKDRGDVPMENRDGISHSLEERTPVQTERKHEDPVNSVKEMQGDETQYGDGMFDDLYGDEMEIVQDYAEKFGKATTTKAVSTVEIHSHTRNTIDNAHCVDESKEYTEYEYFSKVSQQWSPDPEFGIFQPSVDSNMLSSREQNIFSEAKVKKSIPVGYKTPYIEEENTSSFQLRVDDETEISAAFVTEEASGSGQTETIAQCEAANIPDSVTEDEPLKYADDVVHDDFAIEDVEEKFELVNVDGNDVKCKPSSLKTSSKTLKIQKQSGLIRGTPKKLATNFDMKENAASIKREIMGSVTAKSTAKRRALSELQK